MEYIDSADIELLKFALNNFNELFLKHALRNSIIGSQFMIDKDIVNEIFALFRKRMRSELVLNVLLFSDLSRWE
jgi:hypothetical protein